MSKLTDKQKAFADLYIESGNATQSAIGAGYSPKTASVIGAENLIKPNIKSYIDERLKVIASKRIMSAQEALELLTSIARGDEKETVIVGGMDGAEEFEKEADLKTRIAAIREILKRYPNENPMIKQQIRKLTAEADVREYEAQHLMGDGEDDKVVIVDDIPRK